MKNLVKSFAKTESGAVTMEFLVIAAAVVGLGVMGAVVMPNGNVEANADHEKAIKSFVDGF